MNDWLCYFGSKDRFEFPMAKKRIVTDELTVFESGESRFKQDGIISQNDDFVIVLDALILNKQELFDLYQVQDLLSLIQLMYERDTLHFFDAFRGPFTGFLYDKRSGRVLVFTNQTGDSAVFCYDAEGQKVFSSNFYLLSKFLKVNALSATLDPKAVHWMLTFGYLIDDSTFIKEVHRLCAGKMLCFDGISWQETVYHRFVSGGLQISEEQAVEQLDILFRQAVKRCFDKDIEYGRAQHLADMSAGMDSRMTNCVAKSLGYTNIVDISYSQAGSEEERLSKEAAQHFGNKMIFKSLDDHQFVFDIDRLTCFNFGTYLYTGITGGERLLASLDFNKFGAEHTGQLGDIVIGTFVKDAVMAIDAEALRLSHLMPLDKRYDLNKEGFQNQDLYSLYTRGFQGAMSSWFVRKNYTFALSPFTDVDFLSFCYALPVAYRINHRLYWKWVKRYYPDALTVETSRKSRPETLTAKSVDFSKRAFRKALKLGRLSLFKMGFVASRVNPKSGMNPYDYWYDTDAEMRDFLQRYYHENFPLIASEKEVAESVEKMFGSAKILDKLMALTVLSARKNFF